MATTIDHPSSPPRRGLFSGRPLDDGERWFLATVIAIAAGLAAWFAMQRVPAMVAKDFTYPWRAARALLAGQNPYEVIQPTGTYPFESRFPYPLPAAMVAVPFAWLAAPLAGALFTALSCGALAWGLLREGTWRLWTLAGAPFAMALALAQWSPLLVAGAMLPALGFALALKPTLGLALFAWRPSWRTLAAGAALSLLALALVPTWPWDWLAAARQTTAHPPPVTMPFGWVALLALLCWRRPEARLVAVMALVPQNLYFYDQLPLALVAWNAWSAAALAALSWLAWLLVDLRCADPHFCGPQAEPFVVGLLYLPATLLVLWRGWREVPLLGGWLARRAASRVRQPATDAT